MALVVVHICVPWEPLTSMCGHALSQEEPEPHPRHLLTGLPSPAYIPLGSWPLNSPSASEDLPCPKQHGHLEEEAASISL